MRIRATLAALLVATTLPLLATASPEPYFVVDAINPGLPALEDPPNLETPQACVEAFVDAGTRDDWRRAAASMNFRLVDDLTAERAATLARLARPDAWTRWTRMLSWLTRQDDDRVLPRRRLVVHRDEPAA